MAALRQISQHCNFKNLDEILRNRIVCEMRNEGMQKMLLLNGKLVLKIAQYEAVASEVAQEYINKWIGL